MDATLHDLRSAWRSLAQSPVTSATAVVTLALGIGATSAIFSVINATLLSPLPGIGDPSRLVTIGRTQTIAGVDAAEFDNSSYPNYRDLRDQNAVFSDVAADTQAPLSLSAGGRAERLMGAVVTPNYFRTLEVPFAAGRAFSDVEGTERSGPAVAVISHSVWTRQFDRDPAAIGRIVSLNGQRFAIVGVTAPRFQGVDAKTPQDIWVPMWTARTLPVLPRFFRESDIFENRGGVWIMLYARLKRGTTLEQARLDVETIAARLRAYPDNDKNGWTVAAGIGLEPDDRREATRLTTLLFAAVGVLFLLACANVANLALVRSATRVREVAVRLAVGASRARLVRQLLTESLALALLGGGAGLLVAGAGTAWLSALLAGSSRFSLAADLSPDARVVGFTALVSGIAALLFGLGPAIQSSRTDLVPALKQAVAIAPRQSRLRRALVVVQLMLSIVLLIAAGLLLRTIRAYGAIDVGVEARDVVLATVEPSITGRYDAARLRRFSDDLLLRVRSIAGVEAATLGRLAPVTPRGWGTHARIPDKPGSVVETRGLQFNTVATNYFDVMRIPVQRGRGFVPADTASSAPVLVVNDAAARAFWPGENPLTKQIWIRDEPAPRQVVGVAAAVKYRNLIETARPFAYFPLSQPLPMWMSEAPVIIHVRSRLSPGRVAAALEREVHALDPDLPVFDVKPLSAHMADAYWRQRIIGVFTTALAVLALALGSIGMYGVMSFAAAERTREIGVRIALGADPAQVVRMFVGDAGRLIGAGAAAGVALSLAFSRLVASLLLGVDPYDPLTLGAATAILAAVALLSAAAPALRASRVDPMAALRQD